MRDDVRRIGNKAMAVNHGQIFRMWLLAKDQGVRVSWKEAEAILLYNEMKAEGVPPITTENAAKAPAQVRHVALLALRALNRFPDMKGKFQRRVDALYAAGKAEAFARPSGWTRSPTRSETWDPAKAHGLFTKEDWRRKGAKERF